MRRVASCASAMSAAVVTELATHSRPAWRAAPGRADAARSSHAGETPAAASAGAITQSRSTAWSPSQSRSDSSRSARATPVGADATSIERRSSSRATNWDAEIPSPASCWREANTSSLDCWSAPDRADRGRGRVVDLVGETGRQGAQRDERLALAGVVLDASGRADQAAQQVDGEGEPVLADAGQLGRRQPEDARRLDAPAPTPCRCRARPTPGSPPPTARRSPWSPSPPPRGRCGARGRCGRTGAPTSRRPGGPRRRGAPRLVRHLRARRCQLRHLRVGEAREDRDRTQLVGQRHVVAR